MSTGYINLSVKKGKNERVDSTKHMLTFASPHHPYTSYATMASIKDLATAAHPLTISSHLFHTEFIQDDCGPNIFMECTYLARMPNKWNSQLS